MELVSEGGKPSFFVKREKQGKEKKHKGTLKAHYQQIKIDQKNQEERNTMAPMLYNTGPVTQRSMPLWPLLTLLADMFGKAVLEPRTALEAINIACWAAKEGLIELTGAHDNDLVPWDPERPRDDLAEHGHVHQTLVEIKERMREAGLGFHTMTCDLHSPPDFRGGGLTNHDPKLRELAKLKVKRAIRIGHFLNAQVFVYWVARDGFIVAIKTDFGHVYIWIAEGLNEARAYIKKRGFTNYQHGSIEPKPSEPTGHSFIPTAGHAAGFITSPLIEDPEFWVVHPELIQHEGMALLDPITCLAYLIAIGKLGFLHFGNQIKAHEDNDFPPLVGPEGLKETAQMFWLLDSLNWKGVVEFDCHMLREDADPADPIGCMKRFIEGCSTSLAVSLILGRRLEEVQANVQSMPAAQADIYSIIRMCGLRPREVEAIARR